MKIVNMCVLLLSPTGATFCTVCVCDAGQTFCTGYGLGEPWQTKHWRKGEQVQSKEDGGWKYGYQWQEEEGDKRMTEEEVWAKGSSIVLKFLALAKTKYANRVENAQEILAELQIIPEHISQICGAQFRESQQYYMVTP
jgi:hypothetical protein